MYQLVPLLGQLLSYMQIDCIVANAFTWTILSPVFNITANIHTSTVHTSSLIKHNFTLRSFYDPEEIIQLPLFSTDHAGSDWDAP
jgi:hypothetical protein